MNFNPLLILYIYFSLNLIFLVYFYFEKSIPISNKFKFIHIMFMAGTFLVLYAAISTFIESILGIIITRRIIRMQLAFIKYFYKNKVLTDDENKNEIIIGIVLSSNTYIDFFLSRYPDKSEAFARLASENEKLVLFKEFTAPLFFTYIAKHPECFEKGPKHKEFIRLTKKGSFVSEEYSDFKKPESEETLTYEQMRAVIGETRTIIWHLRRYRKLFTIEFIKS